MEYEADGGCGCFQRSIARGVMRSRKRGKEESGGGGEDDEKQDRLLSGSRGFTTHVLSDVVCGAPAGSDLRWRLR